MKVFFIAVCLFLVSIKVMPCLACGTDFDILPVGGLDKQVSSLRN
jgi:hypothetical protein